MLSHWLDRMAEAALSDAEEPSACADLFREMHRALASMVPEARALEARAFRPAVLPPNCVDFREARARLRGGAPA